jgi:hypothetical protein
VKDSAGLSLANAWISFIGRGIKVIAQDKGL